MWRLMFAFVLVGVQSNAIIVSACLFVCLYTRIYEKPHNQMSCNFPWLNCSVVTVSKILLSVGFGRFCKKNRGFRFGFGFCLSRFPPVVNVVCLCGPLHIKPAAVCYIFLCITPVDSSKYQTAWDWWRENHHLYPTSHVLRNATCLAVCATDIRC